MNERREKEVAFLEARFKRVEENDKQLHAIRVRDAEDYNEMKVKLETDVQVYIFFYKMRKNMKKSYFFSN